MEIINNVPTSSTLYYGNGEVRLLSDGNVGLIELLYGGYLDSLDLKLPEGWKILKNNTKILIYNEKGLSISDEVVLFTYTGKFKPLITTILDWDGNKLTPNVIPENIDYWNNLDKSNWEAYDAKWVDYKGTYII